MKLLIEKHPEFAKLSHYFKKIEALADKMGIDVDDLVHDRRKNSSMYTSFKKNILSIAKQRIDTMIERRERGSSPEAPIVGLTILFSKEEQN